ncbi:carboxylate--amine ligase [Leptospira gomenensis]|uniref:Carboxylate--amine ligase n=1 Tax=Leptospira gomenensis TaxID=2484974 RepID=A0A5F1Z085_9LEPT|nr:circularly permuted type 2 ATP-grasp protein [Leptospira gomenensis]TGK31147.1 carboxylate--amine ligase [Leptospira gomenensis]TGK35630.1 carboxylate--amine ligase [Leptospira gomenensis]TGK45417.1 carboxylate--amine ligase [Leptospira gomenensis]TGK66285.1 carboxylate--amine ligase [Leptospira gomenensis]
MAQNFMVNQPNARLNLREGYVPIPSLYDELYDGEGKLRNKYEFLINSLDALTQDELNRRKRDSLRLLQENGVTYNVYEEPGAVERLWSLDLFPVLMESKEWEEVERGLVQRAELLDAIFKDVYGSRKLVYDRKVPPEILFGSQDFLRQCNGFGHSTTNELCFMASDLARQENGSFVVIGDRIQAPSGSGYALENRIVLSRIFPSIYRDSQVHRVALYFRSLRKALQSLSKVQDREPVIVLLTPGSGNETYFEHAYLAGYLGFTLAQAEDLTVRNNFVFIKTVEGLQQVDVIFRRVVDVYMDPLELKGDSLLGIPGILNVIREGNVRVANPIGSGFLENRALHPFLSSLCRYYLSEDLILPNVRTLWMGNPESVKEVFDRPERFVFKPAVRDPMEPGVFLSSLPKSELEEIRKKISLRPERYVSQEIVNGSTCPVLSGDKFAQGRSVFRAFTALSENGYMTMSGGLVRVTENVEDMIVTNQTGAVSKDLWILASEEKKDVSLLPGKTERMQIRRSGAGIPSRVADNMFWMGRYAERTENQARLLRETILNIVHMEESYDRDLVRLLLQTATHVTATYPGFLQLDLSDPLTGAKKQMFDQVFSHQLTGSIRSDLNSYVRASKSVRDRLSEDSRYVLSMLETDESERIGSYDEILEYLILLITRLASLSGLGIESMSREAGWYFMNIGKRIERASYTIRLVTSVLNLSTLYNKSMFESLLNINDIKITYRRRYRYRIEADSVLDILLFDETNPRSLVYQLRKLGEYVSYLPHSEKEEPSAEERIVSEIRNRFAQEDAKRLFEYVNPALSVNRWLNDINYQIASLSDSISSRYFRYLEEQIQLGDYNG